ncbi:MAG: flagellin [Candidatus Muiribacteriota bacterium]
MNFGIINSNVPALNSLRRLRITNQGLNQNFERLSSGLRINKAADDAAGLAVSEKMRAQIGGLDQAGVNTQNAISMVQTSEGVMDTMHSILQRMRVLSVQSASDSYTNEDRMKLQLEINQLIDQVDRISEYTEFNTKKLLNGDTLGRANTSNRRAMTGTVTGEVMNADYSVTVLQAGTASNIHGNRNIKAEDPNAVPILRDAGIYGKKEFHLVVDEKTTLIEVDEEDSLTDLINEINKSNAGVMAGLDAEGNDITMTSVHSGPRFNISFGDDPDGVALALGFYAGGIKDSPSSSIIAVNSTGTSLARSVFTSGTETIISITNITQQELFKTIPGKQMDPGGYGQSLGVFSSSSRIFTEKEFSNPINTLDPADNTRPMWPEVEGEVSQVDLTRSNLLKGFNLYIDGQVDYGTLRQTPDVDAGNWTDNWPDDPNIINHYRVAVPGERELPYNEYQSLTTAKVSIRDTRQVYQIGANEGQTMIIDYPNLSAEHLGLTLNLRSEGAVYNGKDPLLDGSEAPDFRMHMSIRTQKDASASITLVEKAIQEVSYHRSRLGAYQNSLEKTVDYLGIAHENQVASESRIRDVDMAKEMSALTKSQILIQSGTSMLAQANQNPQNVLQLLG